MNEIYLLLSTIEDNIPENVKKYTNFCEKVKIQTKELYGEHHHILPKSMFPNYSKKKEFPWNIKRLSAKDHLIAHYLLFKAFPKSKYTAYSLLQMNGRLEVDIKIDPVVYEKAKNIAREAHRQNQLGRKQSQETITKRVKKTTGQKRTKKQRENISIALKGTKKPPRTEEHQSKITKKITGKIRTEEQRKHYSDALMGIKKSPEHVEKIAIQLRGRKGYKDEDGVEYFLHPSDEMVLSGKVKPFNRLEGVIMINKKTGEKCKMKSDDIRWMSPDWVGINFGKNRYKDSRTGKLRFLLPDHIDILEGHCERA